METRISDNKTAIEWLKENKILVTIENNEVKLKRSCPRCAGTGYWSRGHRIENGICFKCGGSGDNRTEFVPVKKYAQKLKREKAAREKKVAKRLEKINKRKEKMLEGQRNWCEKNGFGRITFDEKNELEKKRRIEKQEKAVFLGEVKEILELTVTYEKKFSVYSQYGTVFVYKFSDDNGNVLIWKTSTGLYYSYGAKEGDKIQIKGRVKEHNNYKGEKQTVLTRCKVKKID